MPPKIRSDRLTVNGRKNTVLKRKGKRKKNKLEILGDEKEKRRLFLNLYQIRASTLICYERVRHSQSLWFSTIQSPFK